MSKDVKEVSDLTTEEKKNEIAVVATNNITPKLEESNIFSDIDFSHVDPIILTDNKEETQRRISDIVHIGIKLMGFGLQGRVIIGYVFYTLKMNNTHLKAYGYSSVYKYGEKVFNMKKTLICNCMKVYEKFGEVNPETHLPELKEKYRNNYSFSQLVSLVSASEEELEFFEYDGKCKSVKQIREMIKKRKQSRGEFYIDEDKLKEVQREYIQSQDDSIEDSGSDYTENEKSNTKEDIVEVTSPSNQSECIQSQDDSTEDSDLDYTENEEPNTKEDIVEVTSPSNQSEYIQSQGDSIEDSGSDYTEVKELVSDNKEALKVPLYEKQIQITKKVTVDIKTLTECLKEFINEVKDCGKTIKIAFYRCNDEKNE